MSSLQSLFSLYKHERVTKYQRGIAKVTDAEIDKWVEESVNVGKEKVGIITISYKLKNFFLIVNMLQGEPSVRRSPRPIKRVNYAKIDGSDKEKRSGKIRRVNSTAHSQSM